MCDDHLHGALVVADILYLELLVLKHHVSFEDIERFAARLVAAEAMSPREFVTAEETDALGQLAGTIVATGVAARRVDRFISGFRNVILSGRYNFDALTEFRAQLPLAS